MCHKFRDPMGSFYTLRPNRFARTLRDALVGDSSKIVMRSSSVSRCSHSGGTLAMRRRITGIRSVPTSGSTTNNPRIHATTLWTDMPTAVMSTFTGVIPWYPVGSLVPPPVPGSVVPSVALGSGVPLGSGTVPVVPPPAVAPPLFPASFAPLPKFPDRVGFAQCAASRAGGASTVWPVPSEFYEDTRLRVSHRMRHCALRLEM